MKSFHLAEALTFFRLSFLVVVCFLQAFPCQAEDLATQRKLLLQGKFEEAREGLEKLLSKAAFRQEALVALSHLLEETGEIQKAVQLLADEKNPSPQVLGRLAQLEYQLGKWDISLRHCEQGLKAQPDELLCRWIRGRIWFDSGELEKGQAEFLWFVRTYSERLDTPKAFTKAADLCLIAQASLEHANWNGLGDELPTILKDLLGDAIKAEPDYWPAEALAGQILSSKYNRPESLAAFDKVLTIHPENPSALTGKAQAALDRLEYAEAESLLNRALKSNPQYVPAMLAKASLLISQGELEPARKELAKARGLAGRHEKLLGMLAGIAWLEGRTAELQTLETEVQAFDKKPAVFHAEMAEILSARRRFQESMARYQKAIDLRPNLPEPHIGLAMLNLQLGNEAEAKKQLERGFARDPFHVRASNSLKVLKHLESYKTLETEHFLIRHDPKNDSALAAILAFQLEQIHSQLAARFRFTPKGKTLVEIFSSHEMFSGRTVALPDLHTIGACTGKVVTMVSPQGKSVSKPFNWNRVMRHELTHIFNLEQSNFMTPHWLTEGLAVSQEGYPKPAFWAAELQSRLQSDRLFDLGNIQLGFQRPRSPMDWQMAYCQSLYYVEFFQSKHGPEAPRKLLEAFGRGLGTETVLKQELKMDPARAETEFKEYLRKELPEGKLGQPSRSVSELKKILEKSPPDADAQGEMAWQIVGRDKAQARKLAEAALATKPSQGKALLTLAKLAKSSGDSKQEQSFLEQACKSSDDPEAFFQLGRMFYESSEFPKALELFQKGLDMEPANPRWLEYLSRTYAQMDDKPKQMETLQKLCEQNPDDLEKRKRLLGLAIKADRKADAYQAARWVLEIDANDSQSQGLFLEQLKGQGKIEEAKMLEEAFKK